jgi:uncharacterized membrane protein
MTSIFAMHWQWLLAIVLMGLTVYATRISGLLIMRGVEVKGRLKAALDAVPPSVLTAVITPTVFLSGHAETIAALLTATAALFRMPLLVTILTGVVSVVALRWLGV